MNGIIKPNLLQGHQPVFTHRAAHLIQEAQCVVGLMVLALQRLLVGE